MSRATFVPPGAHVDADDAWTVLKQVDRSDLATDALLRFRFADGFSYARSLAFQVVLAVFPGLIMVVAVAARMGEGRVQGILREAIETVAPGPASDIFMSALEQGNDGLGRGNTVAIVVGGMAALISATAALAQLQRGATRIYGIDEDRPTKRRYGLAVVLALTVGVMLVAGFLAVVLGSSVAGGLREEVAVIWTWARWPLGILIVTAALAILFKIAPNRRQPSFGWLMYGSITAVLGWLGVSVALSIYINASTTFGETYGPLAGIIGFMLWAQLSAAAVLYGIALAAQLEARVAGVDRPTTFDHDATPRLAGA